MVSSSMNVMFGIFNLGGGEIILILALILIMFGAKKLPELAKGLGSGIKEFKKATREVTDEISNAMDDTTPPPRRISQTAITTPPASAPEQPEQTVPQSSSVGNKA